MNSKPKRYRLLKDLPEAAAGDTYKCIGNSDLYKNERQESDKSPVIEYNTYFKWQVENNPEWFEEINEVTVLTHFAHDNMSKYYWFRTLHNKEIPKDKFPSIIEAIEKVLNGKDIFDGSGHNWRLTDEDGQSGSIKLIRKPAKYTQEELDKAIVDAFAAARLKEMPCFNYKYDTPNSYLLSLHEKKSV